MTELTPILERLAAALERPPLPPAIWRRGKAKALVDGLTFHDLRREATTRLAKKLDVLELAKVTGHRDLRVLSRVYYAPDMQDVASKLD